MFLISASKACRIISRSVCIRARSSSKDRHCLCNDISFSLECGDKLDYVLVYASDSFVTDIYERTRRDDDDCFYYHSWRNNVIIAFGTLSSWNSFAIV